MPKKALYVDAAANAPMNGPTIVGINVRALTPTSLPSNMEKTRADNAQSWDFTKWQHDLVRANLKPYDFNEYEVIKRETSLADQEFESKSS